MANPRVEVWLPDARWAGVAEDVTDHADRIRLFRAALIGSGFAAWLFGLFPKTMSDAELESLLASYRLIHVRRTEALTGPGGPGDLTWGWPLIAAAALLGWLRGRRARP